MDISQQCRELLDAFTAPADQWSWLQRGACLGMALTLGFAVGFELWHVAAGRDGDVQRRAIDALQTRIAAATRTLAAGGGVSAGRNGSAAATDIDAELKADLNANLTANLTADTGASMPAARLGLAAADTVQPAYPATTATTAALSPVARMDWLARVAVTASDSGLHLDKLQPASSGAAVPLAGPAIRLKARGTFADVLRFSRRLAAYIPELTPDEVHIIGKPAQLRMVATLRAPRQSKLQSALHPSRQRGQELEQQAKLQPEPQPELQPERHPGPQSSLRPRRPASQPWGPGRSIDIAPSTGMAPDRAAMSATVPGGAQSEQLDPFGGPPLSVRLAVRSIGLLTGIFRQGKRRIALVQSGEEFAVLKVGAMRAGARVIRIGNRSITVAVGALPAYTMVLADPAP